MLIEELKWRGMFQDAMPGTAEHLASAAPVSGYIGFDPTAASLHIGNLASIMLLVHLQRAGHRPVALVGGATGMIGDPSGKSAERNLLDEDTLRANQAGIGRQLQKFLDFNDSPTGALLVNNYDWFKDFGYLGFLRDVGKHLTVNYMMAKDSVQNRINRNRQLAESRLKVLTDTVRSLRNQLVHNAFTVESGSYDLTAAVISISEELNRITFQMSSEYDSEETKLLERVKNDQRDWVKAFWSNSGLDKDAFDKALDSEGISYTEFSYQLLQGYDFFHLYQTLGCTLQMGGSDQWGNITTGTELIRRMGGPEAKAYALTGQLITKADGSKYGKSESGAVWLDPALTSPFQFYQFFLNSADADVKKLIRVFTLLPKEEIERLELAHDAAPHQRILQKALAQDVTTRVHSAEAAEAAMAASQVLYGGGDLAALDEPTLLDVFAGTPRFEVSAEALGAADVATLLSEGTGGGIFSSKGEARKMVQNNGLKINRQRVADAQQPAAELPLLLGQYLVVQKGKNYALVHVVA